MAGRLTTHVLDTARGTGAAGLRVALVRHDPAGPATLAEVRLDEGGRATLLDGGALVAGRYTLTFHAADYQRARGLDLEDPPFLEVVPVQFGVADPGAHYHVPLILSPYGYSTYRGG